MIQAESFDTCLDNQRADARTVATRRSIKQKENPTAAEQSKRRYPGGQKSKKNEPQKPCQPRRAAGVRSFTSRLQVIQVVADLGHGRLSSIAARLQAEVILALGDDLEPVEAVVVIDRLLDEAHLGRRHVGRQRHADGGVVVALAPTRRNRKKTVRS